MNSREKILQAVQKNQPALLPVPPAYATIGTDDSLATFIRILESIGGTVHYLQPNETVADKIKVVFPQARNVVSTIDEVSVFTLKNTAATTGHSFENIDLAIMNAAFGVAENGAVWLTEQQSKIRVLPFIAEHLVVLLHPKTIMATMHDAYEKIGNEAYDFGVFIAGPSKTADIEQSLVLGAHGPKTMTIFIAQV